MSAQLPEFDIDLFSDENLLDPYPIYQRLRDAGSVVWMRPTGMFAVPRYEDAREVLLNGEVFSSARGVAMNETTNQAIAGGALTSDGAYHQKLRAVMSRSLSPPALRALSATIEAEAERLIDRLVAKGRFDAASELAQHLPVSIISFLVGLPEEGRERMLEWAAAAFNTLGPENDRCRSQWGTAYSLGEYVMNVPRERLKPGGWADQAMAAADCGELTEEEARRMIMNYVAPSLDTTILATSSALWLFARHPEQWNLIRENPALIPQAINEVLRIESPIQVFSRYVARDHQVGDVVVPEGSRLMVLFGSANRDERKWTDPERFDVTRAPTDHLAFGRGAHMCVGNLLARLELKALLTALAERVDRFELGDVRRGLNNTLRGLARLEVAVH